MKKITSAGQLKPNDKIMIIADVERYTYPCATVKQVIMNGDSEEILIDKRKNYYFITSMMLNGTSWAKEVYKL